MTKKAFKEAMLRGLGRCVLAVRQEPEKYRELVLWACKRNIAYDTQCEGTRAWYVYTMANYYRDVSPFIEAAAEALKKYRFKGGWDLSHLGELLMFFAMDGHIAARKAVEGIYEELLTSMLKRKRRPYCTVFHELGNLETLGCLLADSGEAFLRIAKDFGGLYRTKSYLYDGDFDCFYSFKGRRYRKTLERAAKSDKDIACFLKREQAYEEEMESQWNRRREAGAENVTGPALSLRLRRQKDREKIREYAQAYRDQIQPEERAEALKAFCWCSYPDDPAPIIADIRSECDALANAAWRALEHIRHPLVRSFALENYENGIRTEENFAILATNYTRGDGELLESLLQEEIEAKDWDNIHGMCMNVIRSYNDFKVIPRPKHLLPILYQYNPCSCCRESVLGFMSKHRMLTKPLLEECLYDSYDHIRTMAAKKWNK